MRTLPLVVIAVASLAACKHERKATPAPAAAATTPASAAAASPEMRTLSGRLAYEAAHRPAAAARVEDVLAAATKAGVVIDDVKQYLATTAAASYCAGGRTKDGLAVAVCEYPDGAAASAGRAHVETMFAALDADRRIVVRGATTLTTTAPPGADLTATRAAVEHAFQAL